MNEDRLLNLRYWLELLYRHRWMIAGCVVGVTSIATLISLQLTPIYESSSTLYFAAPQIKTLNFQDIYTQGRMRPQERLLTLTKLIGSTPVLDLAVRELEERGLLSFDEPEPLPEKTWLTRIIDFMPWRAEPEPLEETAEMRRDRYIRGLGARLQFETIGSGMAFLKIGVLDENPRAAAALANAVTTAYMNRSREMLVKGADDAVAWLESKLEEQQARLVKAEENLRKYSSAGSVNVDDTSKLMVRELSLLQENLMNTRLRIMAEESREAVAPKPSPDGVDVPPPLAPDVEAEVAMALRARVRADLIDTSVQLDQLKQRLGDRHPDVIQAMDKKKRLEEQLASLPAPTILNPISMNPADPNARVPVEMLRAQEKLLSENLDRALKSISAEGEQGTKAEIYRREVEIQRNLYGQMLSRKNEIILSAKMDGADMEVFERAVPRSKPVSPNHARTIALAIAVSLILGLGIAVIREHLDQSVRDPDHAFDLMKAPVLGMIPFDAGMKRKSLPNSSQSILSRGTEEESQTDEAYQVLRSHIEGAQPNGAARILLVTSAVPGEGKSTTAAHLAAAFSNAGDRILLLDGDFRRPSLSRYFNLDLQADLSDVLRGKVPPEKAIHRDESSLLDIIATRVGCDVPQGARLTQTFESLFSWAKNHYDRVIVDMPVVMVPISSEVARAGAVSVLVHRPGFASAKVLSQVREHLTLSKMPLLGIVLNGVRMAWLGDKYPLLYNYYSSSARPSGSSGGTRRQPNRQLTE